MELAGGFLEVKYKESNFENFPWDLLQQINLHAVLFYSLHVSH